MYLESKVSDENVHNRDLFIFLNDEQLNIHRRFPRVLKHSPTPQMNWTCNKLRLNSKPVTEDLITSMIVPIEILEKICDDGDVISEMHQSKSDEQAQPNQVAES